MVLDLFREYGLTTILNRRAVLKKVRDAAKARGLDYREVELTNHTGIVVGKTRSTIGRHAEVAEGTARALYK